MLIRVADPSKPAFQLRKGEDGISVFDTDAVDPPLTETEILASFRPGSDAIALTVEAVENKGLKVVPIPGAPVLPDRLQTAHAEIQAGPGMSRGEFKQRLKELG
jgi:hypothetical protein